MIFWLTTTVTTPNPGDFGKGQAGRVVFQYRTDPYLWWKLKPTTGGAEMVARHLGLGHCYPNQITPVFFSVSHPHAYG